MSKRTSGNNINGIILLNKRLGVSSNRALQEVRRLFNANKAGHTGSLDPLATGVLPLCFGEATKVSSLMLDDDKRYTVTIQLGVLTDTGDKEGQVLITKPVPDISSEQLTTCLKHFTGAQQQIPPMYSALKYQGKKLYELAREGITIERVARAITIFSINVLSFENGQLTLDVHCSKGTYIRSLAQDIGEYFNCGGNVIALHRTQAGIFDISQTKTLEELTALSFEELTANLLAVDIPLQHYRALALDENQTARVQQGQVIDIISDTAQGLLRLYHDNAFLGLGELSDNRLAPKRIFNL
jgi:tRNA pseudouridine55 synthase